MDEWMQAGNRYPFIKDFSEADIDRSPEPIATIAYDRRDALREEGDSLFKYIRAHATDIKRDFKLKNTTKRREMQWSDLAQRMKFAIENPFQSHPINYGDMLPPRGL